MNERKIYNKYSEYLKTTYGEKVYKLPVQLPVTCPNRIFGGGCSFCAEVGTGFEALKPTISITEQLSQTQILIQKKYKAEKYIAYFQNYTNTFLPLNEFKNYIEEAAAFPSVVEVSISTRPDCIRNSYLEVLKQISETYSVKITIELGLQTANYRVLDAVHRGHSLAEYIDAVMKIKPYGFTICTHLILNLPGDEICDTIETAKIVSALKTDVVKLHSLYIAKHTDLANRYEAKEFQICSKEEYLERLKTFLEYLDPAIIVERLFSRIPEEDSIFSNWNTSWWKLSDEFMEYMNREQSYQGRNFHYLDGSGLRLLDTKKEEE